MHPVGLDLAEIRGECELLFPRQPLLGKDDDVMREKRRDDRILQLRRQRLREVNAGDPDTARRR